MDRHPVLVMRNPASDTSLVAARHTSRSCPPRALPTDGAAAIALRDLRHLGGASTRRVREGITA